MVNQQKFNKCLRSGLRNGLFLKVNIKKKTIDARAAIPNKSSTMLLSADIKAMLMDFPIGVVSRKPEPRKNSSLYLYNTGRNRSTAAQAVVETKIKIFLWFTFSDRNQSITGRTINPDVNLVPIANPMEIPANSYLPVNTKKAANNININAHI